MLSVAPPVPTVTASAMAKPDDPVVAKLPPLIVIPPAPLPSGAALLTETVLPLPIVVAPVKLEPLAPVNVVVPVPVKFSAAEPVIAPDNVKPPLSLLLKVPPPVPNAIAFDSAIAVEPVVASVPFARLSPPVDILAADEIDKVPVPFTVVA